MTQREAVTIVLQMAEEVLTFGNKHTADAVKKELQAVRIVSQLIQHGKFSDEDAKETK